MIVTSDAGCVDTDNGATNMFGYGCTYYTDLPSACDMYDDNDFVATEICCECGGGTTGNISNILYDMST